MFQNTKDKFQSISTGNVDKYVKDVKLNKDKHGNFWIKPIMEDNVYSSIKFTGQATLINNSIKLNLTNVSPLLLAIYDRLENIIDKEALVLDDKTINNSRGNISIFVNRPSIIGDINNMNISGELSFKTLIIRDYLKITFNVRNIIVVSSNEKKYINLDGSLKVCK